MATPPRIRQLGPDEFLLWEAGQVDRYELVDGVPYAMAGAGRLHEEVAGAMFALLWAHLEGKPCLAFKGDRKLQIGTDFFYPDVAVTCDEADRQADGAIKAPLVLIEVLSRPTAAFDRGEKRDRYVRLPSLAVMLIINPERRIIERSDRATGWNMRALAPNEPIVIDAIGVQIEQARVFGGLFSEGSPRLDTRQAFVFLRDGTRS